MKKLIILSCIKEIEVSKNILILIYIYIIIIYITFTKYRSIHKKAKTKFNRESHKKRQRRKY